MAKNFIVPLDRFWLPAGKSYSLTSDGWLSDPASTSLWRANAEAMSTRALADRQCVVLLGEPGMGKTSALAGGQSLRPQVRDLQELHFDLGTYASEDRLVRAVFESDNIATWKSGSGTLCLTLDGFDEALNRVETLGRLLGEYLAGWDCRRLFIRLVCRTADWPHALRDVLEDRFGEVDIHELLPLRRSDAALLLGAEGLDAEQILAAVEHARIAPLAARPLTLKLIRSSIGPDGSLPQAARELYERGLAALLDEMNPERGGSIRPPGTVARRMHAAQRIAALSLFSGRPTLWTGPVAEAVPDDLTVDECVGVQGRDSAGVSSDDVDGALRSGVFTGAGASRLTWSHATFADFLGAKWILDKELDDGQVKSLLVANDGRIYARVRQVAAWLVGLSPTRFRHLIRHDPEAFLGSVDLPEETVREEIVATLLQGAKSGRIFAHYDIDYSGLQHSRLGEQLRAALNAAQGDECRIALKIARQCSVLESLPDLTALALNDRADPPLRTSAAMTVHYLSASAPSHDLVTLIGSATGRASELDVREMEAAALMASWPHAVSTQTVFSLLSPSHPRNYYGVYSIFVDHFAQRLGEADLEAACAWMLDDISRVDDGRLSKLTSAILRLCVLNLNNDRAREVVSAVALRRIEDLLPAFGAADSFDDRISMDTDTRRAVTRLLLGEASEEQVWGIVHQPPRRGGELVHDDDLAWLLDLYASSDGSLKVNAGRAAQELYKPELFDHSGIVLSLPDDNPAAPLFAYWRSAIELDSEAAIAARGQWREHARRRRELSRNGQGESGDEWVNPRIAEEIAKAVAGDASAFWYAARLVTARPGTQSYTDEHQPDLTLHPRWATLSEAVRSDFLIAARTYLEKGECRHKEWLARNMVSYPAQAGYRALVLLLRLAPAALEDVSPGAWREWAPILIDWTAATNGASEEDKRRLLGLARPHADEQLRETMLTLVDKAIADESHVFLRTEFEVLSSDVLARELVDRLSRPMAPDTRRPILDFLIERHLALIKPVLRSWLGSSSRTENPVRAHDAAYRLLRHDAAGSWSELSALMRDDPLFMESALLAGAQAFDRRAPELMPQDLADLYLWLCDHFPAEGDPKFEDVHAVGSRESVGMWRDALLVALAGIGTRDAVVATERIARARPNESWLTRVLADAERALREKSWEPLTPDEIDQLAESRRARVVRSDSDLLAATLGALDEIQARLQADTPSSYLLWDTHGKRPKSEEEISDYLAIELEQRLAARGVVVNREVQVRRSQPSGLAERTDLRIEAAQSDHVAKSTGTLRIPGEIKGIWNPKVVESLGTQLVQRYMADFQTDHGVYVVAWFDQESWSTSDGRRGRAASYGGVADVRARLEREAQKQRAWGNVVAVRVLDCSLRRPNVT